MKKEKHLSMLSPKTGRKCLNCFIQTIPSHLVFSLEVSAIPNRGVIHYKSSFVNTPGKGNYSIVFELKNLILSKDVPGFAAETNQKLLSIDSLNSVKAKFYLGSPISFLWGISMVKNCYYKGYRPKILRPVLKS